MENQEYITPTKQSPVFTAYSDYFGVLERSTYKRALISDCTYCVFATSYIDAVNELHEWIKNDYEWMAKEIKSNHKFEIYIMDGSVDKYGDAIQKSVYSISIAKCKKLIWNK